MKTLLATILLTLSLNADMCSIYLKQTYKNLDLSNKAHDLGFYYKKRIYSSMALSSAKEAMLYCKGHDYKYAKEVVELMRERVER